VKIALFGANGQLGSDIRMTKPGEVDLIPLTRKEVDVTNHKRLDEILREISPDFVCNTAAYVRVDEAEDDPVSAYRVNSIAIRDMAIVCRNIGAGLLQVSTDYVFDGEKGSVPYTEKDCPNPVNTYGLSKYTGEVYIKNILENYYIVRLASLYGKAGASGKGGNFIYTILRRARDKEPMRIVNDIYMSPTYTLDAAIKIWELILGMWPYGIYHLTNSGYCSWFKFTKEILKLSDLEGEIVSLSHDEYKTKARRPLWSPLISEKGIAMRPWEEALGVFLSSLRIP